jgi:hypothetical protein
MMVYAVQPPMRTPPIFRIILLIAIIAFLHFFLVARYVRKAPAITGMTGWMSPKASEELKLLQKIQT